MFYGAQTRGKNLYFLYSINISDFNAIFILRNSLHQLVGLVGVGLIPSLLKDETIQMNILPFFTSIDSVCF